MPVRASRRCATARAPPGRGGWAGHAAARRPLAEERVRVHDTRRPARPAHRLGPRGCGPGELRRLHLPLSVRARGAVGYSATLPRGRRAEGLAASRPRRTEPPVSHGGVCAPPICVPVRGCPHVRQLAQLSGQGGGESHLEQISVDGLLRLRDAELGPGVTELTCHAGYVDEGLPSSYTVEREAELRTLCD